VLVGVLVTLLTDYSYGQSDISIESKLQSYLRVQASKYGSARPIKEQDANVTVWFGLRLIQVSIDAKSNLMETSVWVRQKWYDQYLTWNASDFNNQKSTTIPSDWVWTPDLTLVNTGSTKDSQRTAMIRVHSDGYMWWLQHRMFKSACLIDLTEYPYDTQDCNLWFQSMSNPSGDLDPRTYKLKSGDEVGFDLDTYLSDFKKADEWEVVKNESIRCNSPREHGEMLMFSSRATLRYSLTLRRRTGFTAYLLIVPCIVLGAMSILVFVLPPERPDRHAIGTTLMTSFVLLLLILINTAPPSAAAVPKLGLLYAANIFIVIISLSLSSIVVNMSKRGERGTPFPRYFIKPTKLLARLFCVPIHTLVSLENALQQSLFVMTLSVNKDGKSEAKIPEENGMTDSVPDILHSINRKLDTIKSSVTDQSSVPVPPPQGTGWKTLAAALDRLFMCVQCTLIVLALMLFYPRGDFSV